MVKSAPARWDPTPIILIHRISIAPTICAVLYKIDTVTIQRARFIRAYNIKKKGAFLSHFLLNSSQQWNCLSSAQHYPSLYAYPIIVFKKKRRTALLMCFSATWISFYVLTWVLITLPTKSTPVFSFTDTYSTTLPPRTQSSLRNRHLSH